MFVGYFALNYFKPLLAMKDTFLLSVGVFLCYIDLYNRKFKLWKKLWLLFKIITPTVFLFFAIVDVYLAYKATEEIFRIVYEAKAIGLLALSFAFSNANDIEKL